MAGPKTAPLEPKIVDRLLDLLSDSDKFRELFQQDPAAALALIGHVEAAPVHKLAAGGTASPSIAGCMQVAQLASKQAISAARSELREMLLFGLAYTTPNLDATYSAPPNSEE